MPAAPSSRSSPAALTSPAPGASAASPALSGRSRAREVLLLFLVALLVRVGLMFVLHSPDDARGASAWEWGYESACIAQSVADGRGYAGQWNRGEAPWDAGSGLTGWLTPVYPGFLALLMKTLGGVTPATAFALFFAQSLLSALTCVMLWSLGRALGEDRAGRLAAWIFCFDPAAIWNASHTVWDTTFVACALTSFLWLLFRWGPSASAAISAAAGAAFGALLLVNPAPGSILPVALIFIALQRPTWRARLRCAAAFGAAAFLVCAPWCLRNQRAIGAFALRTNLGVELMVGNNAEADGYFQSRLHPSYNAGEFRRYRAIGEAAYSKECEQRARDWIEEDVSRFVQLSLHRAMIFWTGDLPWLDPRREGRLDPASDPKSWIKWLQHAIGGLGCLAGASLLARRSASGKHLLAMLMLFPAPYYVTHVLERYRFPIEPLIVLACAFLVLGILDARRAKMA